MKNLNEYDLGAIVVTWAGAGLTTWLSQEPMVAVVAIIAAYYLTKWVILRTEE